jgi:hypothetical protein
VGATGVMSVTSLRRATANMRMRELQILMATWI